MSVVAAAASRRWFGRRPFPIVPQVGGGDCGPACLDMVTRFHGRTYSRRFIRELCPPDRQGTSLAALARAAERLGFRARCVTAPLKTLIGGAPLPCVVPYGVNHFVVVYRVARGRVFVADPSIGRITYGTSEFASLWRGSNPAGYALLLETSGQWLDEPHDDRAAAARRLIAVACRAELKRAVAPLAVGAIVAFAVQLSLPFVGSALVDAGIGERDLSFIYLVLLAQLVLMASRTLVDTVQTYIVSFVGVRLELRLLSAFLDKLTRLPLPFFDQRRIGELMQHVNDHQTIQQFFVEGVATLLVACLSLSVFGVLLGIFGPKLLLVFLAGSVAYVGYCALFFAYQRRWSYKRFQLQSRNQGLMVEILAGMRELKLHNAERQWQRRWESAVGEYQAAQLQGQAIMRLQTGGGAFINTGRDLLITLLVARAVVAGELTLGTMVAIQAIIGQLTFPLGQLALLLTKSQEAVLARERSREIHALRDETAGTQADLVPAAGGGIELRRVSFSYGGTRESLVLRDVSITIPRGTITALVGRSGCGKTTLINLLLKAYRADAGEIAVGGVPLDAIAHQRWREQCGVVMQDGYIFSDTVRNNIAVGDERPDDERVAEAARVAQIDEFIRSLPLGYETCVGRDGVGLSRGQLQRILIARAIYRQPAFVFLDEATSALDAPTERAIVEQLHGALAGRTAVIAAHRISTVRHAHQIVVMDAGAVVEVGTHDELTRHEGPYFELVRHQLVRREVQLVPA